MVGTQFTWPVGSAARGRYDLTPVKEEVWQHWVSLYKEKMLSKGAYRGDLYDIGFDRPETHAIAKDGHMYYAFFAPEFHGKVQLRGLGNRSYQIRDYENNRDLGSISGPVGDIDVGFSKHLLIEADPR